MTQDGIIIGQLTEMRNEARRLGSRVADDALSHAIARAAKGTRPEMQRWINAAISEMRRIEAAKQRRPDG